MFSDQEVQKIRVLFVGSFFSPEISKVSGGVQFECRSLIDSPVSREVEWDLIDTTMESNPPPGLLRRGYLAGKRVRTFVWTTLMRRPNCCLIYASNGWSFVEKGMMALLARVLGIPVILRPVSGMTLDDYRRGWWWRWWLRLVLRSVNIVACQGMRGREFYQSIAELPVERTPIVYNPVDSTNYDGVLPVEQGSPDKALMIGWIERNKGIWDLMEVTRRYSKELEGMRFVLCGDGLEFDEFRRRIEKENLAHFFELRGRVHLEGKVAALSECSIYLMLSHREGLPNSLLEAMIAGRAVVATSVGSISDFVLDGRTGLLCEARDVEAIGACIVELRLNGDLRARLAAAARERVLAMVAYEVVWSTWRELIQRATRQNQG